MSANHPVDFRRPERLSYRVRDAFVGLLLPVLLWVVRVSPRPLFSRVARFLAWVHYVGSRRETEIARANFRHVLRIPEAEVEPLLRRLCHQQLAIQLESIRGILVPGSVEVEGTEEVKAMLDRVEAQGRGTLLVTGHLGSWELVLHWISRLSERQFHLLAKKTRMAPLTRFVRELRERAGARVLWVGRTSPVKDMIRAIKQGDVLGFAMDQKPRNNRGPTVRFFGLPTAFVGGPGAIAARTQCPVVSVYCLRVAPFRFRLVGRELLPADHGHDDEASLTQVLADDIEAEIRRQPEQWMWTYRRWRFDASGALVDVGASGGAGEAEHAA
ncbi:MAG TPA: lysophospholipid acyltransferase family protein [Thermoanaerobaculia bacterium]|nr:lysophospholipid acyltransferase family protein [Thermoanaerobaculia bacterium]